LRCILISPSKPTTKFDNVHELLTKSHYKENAKKLQPKLSKERKERKERKKGEKPRSLEKNTLRRKHKLTF